MLLGPGDLDELLLEVRQELVERRVDQADDDRQAVHRPEDALEVALLEALELRHRGVEGFDRRLLVGGQAQRRGLLLGGQGLARGLLRLGGRTAVALDLRPGRSLGDEDRAPDDLQPLALAEHVLGPAETDPLGAVRPGLGGLLGLVGVRPDAHPADPVGPAQDRLELGLVLEPGLDRGQRALVQRTGRAVEADPVALLERGPGHGTGRALGGVVDHQVGRPGDARLADLAGHDGRVRGRAAAGGDDPLADGHAVEVVRRGLDPDEDHGLAAAHPLDGVVGVEDGPSDGRAGRGVEAVDDLQGALEGSRVERRPEELLDVGRLDPGDRLLLRDRALGDHVDRDPDGGRGGPLGGPRLEHVEAALLDRELEVLDVPVVPLELLGDLLELVVDGRHVGRHLGDLRRRPDAGDDVLALGVREVLAEQGALARVRIAGEGDAGSGVVAHVAEDHRDDVDRGPEVVRDLLARPVVAGPLSEPAGEDGLDRLVELVVRVGREVLARVLADDRLELLDQRLQVVDHRGPCPGRPR